MLMLSWIALLLLPMTGTHAAENSDARPDENTMFGGSVQPTESGESKSENTAVGPGQSKNENKEESRDEKELRPTDSGKDAFASGEVVDDALKMGGRFYQRMVLSGQEGLGAQGAPFSLPLQFDGFLDARPNDRLRGYFDTRFL